MSPAGRKLKHTVNRVSSLRDLECGVDGRYRRLRYASPAVNSVSSLRDFLRSVSVRIRGLKPAVNKVSPLQGAG
jgi:hypothetical protein